MTTRTTTKAAEADEATEAVNKDLEGLEAPSAFVTLEDGTEVEIERLRTRQLFRLLKVLTTGAGDFLSSINLGADTDSEEFMGNLIAALVLAIPNAEDEAIEFILSMVKPTGLVVGNRLSDNEVTINVEKFAVIQEKFFNPEIDDLFTVIERVVRIEAPHIQSLGKKISLLLETQQKATTAKQGGSSRKSSKA